MYNIKSGKTIKSYEQDFTKGSLFKQILFYSIPLTLTNLLQVFFNITDIAVIGRYAGSLPLASVGSTSQFLFLFTGLLIGLGGGINVIIAYYIGAKSQKDIDEAVHSAFVVALSAGILLGLFGFTFARQTLSMIKTKPELLEGAVSYFSIYMLGMPGVALYNFGNAVLGAAGDTKRPLYFLTIAGIINIVLNLFFVIVCHLDCAGVAIASIISEYTSGILVCILLFRGIANIKLDFKKLKIVNKQKIFYILKIGIPAGLQNAIFAIANTVVQVGVNSFNAVMVAGTAASANLDNIVYNVMGAFYTADATFIGQNYGAGNKKRIRNSILISNAYAFTAGLILSMLLYKFGRQALGIFTNDSAVIDAGMLRLKIMAFSYPIASFMDNTIAANRGLGKTIVPSIIVLLGSCLFRIIWVYTIFAYFKTIPSLFLLYIFSWLLTALAEIIYFIRGYRHIKAIV